MSEHKFDVQLTPYKEKERKETLKAKHQAPPFLNAHASSHFTSLTGDQASQFGLLKSS
jgi:hypothetical protein